MQLKNKYDKPIFVTENGIADKHDRYRAPFIVAHIQQIKRAIDNGANVIGYLLTGKFDRVYIELGLISVAFGIFNWSILGLATGRGIYSVCERRYLITYLYS
jgi:beta-glucosidase/6-phospho-beta-glucosidase/beta-galactosidase